MLPLGVARLCVGGSFVCGWWLVFPKVGVSGRAPPCCVLFLSLSLFFIMAESRLNEEQRETIKKLNQELSEEKRKVKEIKDEKVTE